MIPFEIGSRALELPGGDRSIVIVTGDEPRHLRFALRLQQEFGDRVAAWYQLATPPKPPKPQPSGISLAKAFVKRLLGRAPRAVPASIFLSEIELLRRHAVVEPRRISRADVQGDNFVAELKALDPCFFLTLGGALYGSAVLGAVRGVAINQHAGYSPEYKGNQTTLQALYHRDLAHVAATVHLTSSGADAGPILRRSNPCLVATDSPFTVMERVVALGTELMIESVREISETGNVVAFDQPLTGRTYLAKDCDTNVRGSVQADFANGWLSRAIAARKTW